VNQYSGIVVTVVRIAADMGPLVDYQHSYIKRSRQPLSHHTAGEPGPDYQIVDSAV
jgi:hypothetical protein